MEFIMIDAASFDSLLKKLNKLVDEANKIHNNGKDAILEQWLDGQEVCEILAVTKRTLQTLRETGKMVFRESDIQAILESGFRSVFR